MPNQTDNLVLEHLRAIRTKLDEHDGRFSSIDSHLTALEHRGAGIDVRLNGIQGDLTEFRVRLERIERR
ncbi:MAG: hypothetical protein ACR2PI_08610 [Hyphomicrobiaceae bacterium]